MKRCRCCGENRLENEFGKDRSKNDGLNVCCINCRSLISRGYLTAEIKQLALAEKKKIDAVGGLKITILNHAKKGESIYNIVQVGSGENYSTNSKSEFYSRLNLALGDIA